MNDNPQPKPKAIGSVRLVPVDSAKLMNAVVSQWTPSKGLPRIPFLVVSFS